MSMQHEKIRNLRKQNRLSQEQMAELLGINRATLSKYETGVIVPSLAQLRKIAQILNVSVVALFPDELANDFEKEKEECLPFSEDLSAQESEKFERYLEKTIYENNGRRPEEILRTAYIDAEQAFMKEIEKISDKQIENILLKIIKDLDRERKISAIILLSDL